VARQLAIIREHHFENDLRTVFGTTEHGDAFIAGAEVLLSLEPESGIRSAPDSLVWILSLAPHKGRTVWLYYTFNDSTVFLIGLAVE
jgi:hypothetical protein